MNIVNFKIFCDLVDSESFSQAARMNDITQSAVSQQLRSMEKHFNVLIVDRSQKQFRLTREGAKVLEFSRELLVRYETLVCDIQAMKKVLSGTIHVSTICSIGLHELPPYLKSFLLKFPSINVKVEYRRSNLVYEDILQRRADVGLVAFPTQVRGLDIIPFVEDELILIAGKNHPLAKQKSVGLEDIKSNPFIGFEQDIPTRQATDKFFKEHKLGITPVMEFDNVETVKRAVEIDAGIALVPAGAVEKDLGKTIARLNVEPKLCKNWIRPLAIVIRKNRTLTPAIDKFIKLLRNELTEEDEKNFNSEEY